MSNSKGEIARRRIIKVITDYISSYDYPPTLQEVKELTGIRSFDAVGRHLKRLKEQGLIEWEGLKIKILDKSRITEVTTEQVFKGSARSKRAKSTKKK